MNSGAPAFHALIEGYLAPVLVGQDAGNTEYLWQQMWWKVHYSGRGGHATSAISAVDIALWDLKARRAKMPLWRLLGGFNSRVPCYAGGIDLDFTIDELLAQADHFKAQGFRAIKMKAGRPHLREDVERVRRMREHLGEDFRSWSTRTCAGTEQQRDSTDQPRSHDRTSVFARRLYL